MKTPRNVWNELTDVLEPVTVAEGEIESIRVSVCNGGVKVKTAEPIPTPDYEQDIGDFDPEEDDPQEHIEKFREQREEIDPEDMPENEEIQLYDDFGIQLKQLILDRVEDSVVNTPTLASVSVTRCTVTEDNISPVVTLTNRTNRDTEVKDELATALVEAGSLESEEKLAYGRIDSVYYNDGEIGDDGWEFDGTLYKYTDKPYDYWEKGADTDYPRDMDEWAEFASETEGRKQHILEKDTHVVHFHPMKRGLSDDNPLIQWHKSVRDKALSNYEFNNDVVEDKYLGTIEVDDTGYSTTIRIVL